MAERDLDELFRAWRSEAVPVSQPPRAEDRSGSALVAAALRRVAEQKRRRSQLRRWGTALALAAGLCGLGVGAWYELGAPQLASRVTVGVDEGEVAVTDGVGHVLTSVSELSEGYGVRTERGRASLAFPSGASAKVAQQSTLKITAARTS